MSGVRIGPVGDMYYTPSGTGAVARIAQDKLCDFVSVKDYGVVGDGTNESTKFNAAALAAADAGVPLDLNGLTIRHGGGFSYSTATGRVIWRNGTIKLTNGAKTSPVVSVSGVASVDVRCVNFDGNRANVTGNNAAFFVVNDVDGVLFEQIGLSDLYRYGISVGSSVACSNVYISNVTAVNVGVQSGGASVSLGEAVMVQNSSNVVIDGFQCTNPSGTGDGQVMKVFYCTNARVSNCYISDASPSLVYPAFSCVHNTDISYENVTVSGACQVAMENNANINQHYKNINTAATTKALLIGTDGGTSPARYNDSIVIENWVDTSTADFGFNILGARGLKIKNLTTTKTINVSRDGVVSDRRSQDLSFETVSCAVLNTSLVGGEMIYRSVTVTGLWTNTGVGVARWINSTYGTYSNSAQTNVFLCLEKSGGDLAQISGTMTAAGGTFAYRANTGISTSPFAGEVLANAVFVASSSTQWSQFRFNFYDQGTPTVLKTVIQSGATPRTNVALTVARGTRTLTFTNTEGVDLELSARVVFINKDLAAQ